MGGDREFLLEVQSHAEMFSSRADNPTFIPFNMSFSSKVRKFSCRVLDFRYIFLIFISRRNKLVCAQRASKKPQLSSHFESTFWRYAGLVAGIHCRGKDRRMNQLGTALLYLQIWVDSAVLFDWAGRIERQKNHFDQEPITSNFTRAEPNT